MNRDEAVALYKEITGVSQEIGSNAFKLMLSSKNDQASKGYQIHISMSLDAEIKQQITNIVRKHDLAVKEESGEVIIYEPKKISMSP